MNVQWNIERLQGLLRAFSDACGVNIGLADHKMRYLTNEKILKNGFCQEIQKTEQGKIRCIESDRCLFRQCRSCMGPVIHSCHAGLTDIAVPILWNGEILGYTILGQIRSRRPFCEIAGLLKSLDVDQVQMEQYYDAMPVLDYEKVQSILTLATAFSQYIFLEHTFSVEANPVLEDACAFLETHLQEHISMEDVVQHAKTSKSTLYKSFQQRYNETPGMYLNRLRIQKSTQMLAFTEDSLDEISERVGFSSVSYFSKMFKKMQGISPAAYRKQVRGNRLAE